jgi:glycosyltransferase involved in cell wall biosynthesis
VSSDGTVTTFLFFGTFRQNKGIERYLTAIDALRDDASLRFVFAGRGDDDLEQLVADCERRDHRVSAEIGYISAVRRAELYSSSDVVVMPYTDLPAQSGVLRDAYASGRPVIATDVGALGPAIKADGTGWVVDLDSPDSLEHTLRSVAVQPAERHNRATNAQRIASTRTPSHIAEQIVGVYQKALSASGPNRVRKT